MQPVGHLPPLQPQQASVTSSLSPLPVLNAAGADPLPSYTEVSPPQYIDDSSQYLSKEEIHLAAMEGVKVAHLRTLVSHTINNYYYVPSFRFNLYCIDRSVWSRPQG